MCKKIIGEKKIINGIEYQWQEFDLSIFESKISRYKEIEYDLETSDAIEIRLIGEDLQPYTFKNFGIIKYAIRKLGNVIPCWVQQEKVLPKQDIYYLKVDDDDRIELISEAEFNFIFNNPTERNSCCDYINPKTGEKLSYNFDNERWGIENILTCQDRIIPDAR